MVERIVEARLEITAATNAILVAMISFGVNLNDEQQFALAGVVNGILLVGYRLIKGKPAPVAQT